MNSPAPLPALSDSYQRSILLRIITAATLLLCGATLLSLTARSWWLSDICANLRVQWVTGLSLVVVASLWLKHGKLLVCQLAVMAVHVPWLAAAFASQPSPAASPLIRLTTANVYSSNRRHADIETELLRGDADVVAIIELSHELSDYLADEFTKLYPYSLLDPKGGANFGIGVYSKLPFEDSKLDYFNDESISSVVVRVNCLGQPLRILATHTVPPIGPRAFRHRNKHLHMIAEQILRYRRDEPNVPVVVMGDLNLTPWSPVFRDFAQAAELTSGAEGQGLTPTWYRWPIFPFGLVLDHILATADLQCLSRAVGNDVGSDHRFVTVEFGRMPGGR